MKTAQSLGHVLPEGLYEEYEKKDKLFVGGKVSEQDGANKLSSYFKNSDLNLTSTSRPNPFQVKTSHGQWTTEKKSVENGERTEMK